MATRRDDLFVSLRITNIDQGPQGGLTGCVQKGCEHYSKLCKIVQLPQAEALARLGI